MAKECSNSSCSKESCEGCPSRQGGGIPKEVLNIYSEIGHVIGVVSGKGGVGKSFATASLANQLAKKGFQVGILDADITGPSIPKMYGLRGPARMADEENNILPLITENGVKVMSINLLLPDEEEPVIWRGPVLANMVKQFWTDVVWGELDYLLVDMPPGTGDVPLTVFQSLPVDGIYIVSSPQDLVRMIVTKAVRMAEKLNVPILGLIENYSYIACPDCGKKISVFGESHIDEIGRSLGIDVVGKVPIDPDFAAAADRGGFAGVDNTYVAGAVDKLPG